MPQRAVRRGPPRPRYPSGPNCAGCPFRELSFGYAPADGPKIELREADGTVYETGSASQYTFVLEALGPDEVSYGRNAVGPTGRAFDHLLRENTPLSRSDVTVLNSVRCRPIVWTSDEEGNQIPDRLSSGDYRTCAPSTEQARECAKRYGLYGLLANARVIVAMGSTAAHLVLGRQVSIAKYHGTIFEPGVLVECLRCDGAGAVPGRDIKCKLCKGRGRFPCAECGGVSAHRKKCELPPDRWFMCARCLGTGKVSGKEKKCPECDGSKKVPKEPDKPYVCDILQEGQLLVITYHPAAMFRDRAAVEPLIQRTLSRLTSLEKELQYHLTAEYVEYPRLGTTYELENADTLIIDIETTGLGDEAQLTHFACTNRAGYGAVFHPGDQRIGSFIENPSRIVGQNFVLFDRWVLERNGYRIPDTTEIVDTRYLGKLANPDTPNDLAYLTSEFASPPIRGYWKAKVDYRKHIERVACIDVDATARVEDGLWRRLKLTGQDRFAREYIIPLSSAVYRARRAGMRIDESRMGEAGERIRAWLQEKSKELPAGIESANQNGKIQEYLYEVLDLPVQKKRGTQQPTADKHALETLQGLIAQDHHSVANLDDEAKQEAHRFIDLVLELRDMSKLESSFLRYEASPQGTIHPQVNLAGTATFRPTCQAPNVLQVPSCHCKPPCHGTEKHKCDSKCTGKARPMCKNARWVFVPDEPDWEIMSVDLSQAEVIGFLWYSQQWDALKRILVDGHDAYQSIADKVLGREATETERSTFKRNTLALMYGESERTMSLRLGVSLKTIREERKIYLDALPGVNDFRREVINHAKNYGFVESPFSVRRYVRVEEEWGRPANQAVNAPIQNIPPVVTGRAIIALDRQLPPPARVWAPWVYDEINLVYPRHLRDVVVEAVRDTLGAHIPEMPAPALGLAAGLKFKMDFAVGKNWGELSPLEVKR